MPKMDGAGRGGPYGEPAVRRVPDLEELKRDASVYGRTLVPVKVVVIALMGFILGPAVVYCVGYHDARIAAAYDVEGQLDQCDSNRAQLVETQDALGVCERERSEALLAQEQPSYESVTARTELHLTAPPPLLRCLDVVGDIQVQHRCVAFRWQCWRACTGLGNYYAAGNFEGNDCVCSGPDGLISISHDFTQVRSIWPPPGD